MNIRDGFKDFNMAEKVPEDRTNEYITNNNIKVESSSKVSIRLTNYLYKKNIHKLLMPKHLPIESNMMKPLESPFNIRVKGQYMAERC